MFGKFYFLLMCQILLLAYLGLEQLTNDQYFASYKEYPTDYTIVLCRFLCVIFMHVSLAGELSQSLKMMNYACNHHWKFHSWFHAYFVGFSQMSVLVSVEIVNVAVVLTNTTVMDTIMNFLALVIISDFDDYYFQTVKDEPLSKLISDGNFDFGYYEGEENIREL